MRAIIWIALVGLAGYCLSCGTPSVANRGQEGQDIERKVDSLLALMTPEEKIGQLNMYNGTWEFTGPAPADNDNQGKLERIKSGGVGGMLNVLGASATREAQRLAVENSRLGIPIIFGYDVIHGYRTMMPVPLAQSASWNLEVAKAGSVVAAKEAAAAGQHWTFAPMIDVSRDARWGRIMESAGEDPYLTSLMGKAWIEGYQGNSLADPFTIAACAKHFAAYGFAEGGRDYNTVDISRHTLYNVVLPPFKAASDAGVATFMNAFNEIGGEPATASTWLQRDLLKGQWGFTGFVVSDWGSIGEMISHGYAATPADAGRMALRAGSDMDMESRIYEGETKALLEAGKVEQAWIDDAVRRILRVKFRLGLFDDPYRYCDTLRERTWMMHPDHLAVARDAARKSMVLLKNEGALLPLSPSVKTIAVIGQLAADKDIPLGSWRAQAIANSAVSMLEGIKEAVSPQTQVLYAQGYALAEGQRDFVHELTFANDDQKGFAEAIAIAKKADVVVMALGEDCFQTGEGRSQADIRLKGQQLALFEAVRKVNPKVAVVLMNGRPLAIPEVAAQAPAILEAWFGGSEAGRAIADVLFGAYNPSGKLPVSFPYHVGQEPLYYNRKNTGRPGTHDYDAGTVFWSHYTDVPNKPLFPFGHGLSYSQFQYENFRAEAKEGRISVTATVKNASAVDGTETVQLYIRDVHASATQPVQRLVAFEQVSVPAGGSVQVSFELAKPQLGFYTSNGEFIAEDGQFVVMMGGSSADVQQATVSVSFGAKP